MASANRSHYQLSAVLEGHAADVRALRACSSESLLSSSRDATVICWRKRSNTPNEWFVERMSSEPNGRFASSVASIDTESASYLALGSASGSIFLFDSGNRSEVPDRQLDGHSLNVCALDTDDGTTMISGSWDKTAIVWKSFKPILKLGSHLQAVWAVKCVGSDRFLTASADKLIRLYDAEGNVIQTYAGHSDCVRSLALTLDGHGFWSAGNDGNVMMWSFDSSTAKHIYIGHTSFVYAVAALPDGDGCVSSGEDGSVRVWKNHQLVQTIAHPTISVWTVDVLPNGDIVSGASDSTIRLWTREEARFAQPAERERLDRELRTRALNKTQVGDVRTTDLPGLEALAKAGKKEGQVIMVKNGDKVEAYQWSSNETTWQQIGEVTDAVGSGRKQIYQGEEYDYVFDVDIAENMPPLKLPFNVTENLYTAAEKFLSKNDLPTSYVDQIVKFLETNTQGSTLGESGSQDPFTGGSSYRSSRDPNVPAAGDPFTGGTAYTSSSSGIGPLASYQPGGRTAQDGTTAKSRFIPICAAQYFRLANVEAVDKKIQEIIEGMDQTEHSRNEELYKQLKACAFGNGPSPVLDQYNPELLLDTSCHWRKDDRFPLLDVCRLLCATSSAIASYRAVGGDTVIERLMDACEWELAWEPSRARQNNTMLVVRGLANLTATESGCKVLLSHNAANALSRLASRHSFHDLNRNTRVAFATLALNLSILTLERDLPSGYAASLMQFTMNILSNEAQDAEVAYRSLVALGNILASPSMVGATDPEIIQVAKDLAMALAGSLKEDRLSVVATEIRVM